MKLFDVFVVIQGRTVGPLLALMPNDADGGTHEPAEGDELMILIRPNSAKVRDRAHLYAKAKLQR